MSAFAITLYVFGLIFIAELPDKTAIATLVLATRHRPLPVFIGASLALAIQSVVAVGAGQLLALLPARIVHVGAGLLFVVTAVIMWRQNEDDAPKEKDDAGGEGFVRVVRTSFLVIFLAEWGDLTQLATAALAARFGSPWAVFWAATLALWSVVAIAVTVGHHAGKLLPARIVQRVAAALFLAVGVLFLVGKL